MAAKTPKTHELLRKMELFADLSEDELVMVSRLL